MILRYSIPARSAPQHRTRYQAYKAELRADFNMRCGYCDDSDETFGFQKGFHIEHFAPKSLFPDLTVIYTNLIYSCPLCNMAKSNKWIGENHNQSNNGTEGFVDPCELEYDDHLMRDAQGRIQARTDLGSYMVKNLKLSLLSHQLNWQIRKLEELLTKLAELTDEMGDRAEQYVAIQRTYTQLILAIRDYKVRRRAA